MYGRAVYGGAAGRWQTLGAVAAQVAQQEALRRVVPAEDGLPYAHRVARRVEAHRTDEGEHVVPRAAEARRSDRGERRVRLLV